MSLRSLIFYCALFLSLTACNSSRLDVDSSEVKIDLNYFNFDKVLTTSDSIEVMEKHHFYQKNLTEIYNYQIGYCFRMPSLDDSVFYAEIERYRKDTSLVAFEKVIGEKFNSTNEIETSIATSFQYFNYHFPSANLPKDIVFMNSLLQSSVFCTDKEIGIGIDRYLGSDNAYYKRLNPNVFYDWIKEAWNVEYLERDVIDGWVQTHLVNVGEGSLGERMINYGKTLYIVEACFPDKEKFLVPRYSVKDFEWAIENEYSFWKYLVDEKLLYSIDEKNIRNIFNPAPFTAGIPDQESPDRLGQFMGWRIVRQYMENNTDVTFQQMLDMPYTKILQSFEIE